MHNKRKIILVNPSYRTVYNNTLVDAATSFTPVLSLATIAANVISQHEIKVVDFNLPENTLDSFKQLVSDYKPDFVGITFTTPLFYEMEKIAKIARNVHPVIKIVVGGAHASALPEKTMKEVHEIDILVIGEGDEVFREIINGVPLQKIDGVSYRHNGNIRVNPRRTFIENLDDLPFPAWEIYDLKKYSKREVRSKKTPAGWIETSRGCIFQCIYCNKSVFGNRFRVKSPNRVVDEIEYMIECGFKEIQIADDAATTNIKRFEQICDEMIQRNIYIPWAPVTGIRVDFVTLELLKKMKECGCYAVYYGIESGDPEILKRIRKKIDLKKVRYAVKLANKIGLETCGYFMLGLPGESETAIMRTIEFAKKLDLDLAKISFAIPLPETEWFQELESSNLIKTYDWSKFNYYLPPKNLFDHPTLDWETIDKCFRKFYREFYWRPSYIFKRLIKSIKRGTIFSDLALTFKIKW